MKSVIPFTKELDFNAKVQEITSISLEREFSVEEGSVVGNLFVTGDYKSHEISVNVTPFSFKIPFTIEIPDILDKDSITIEISDFAYDMVFPGDEKYIYAYNEKQIPSEIGKEEYTIGFEAPDRPLIAPVSGKYDYLENIIITVPEGCTVYYAFDEAPTLESSKYTEPVPMQKGEHTFSAIAVDGRGKSSPVTSAVYVYYG